MKARKVKGVEPEGWLAENARRIILVRLDELTSFSEAVHDPNRVRRLHDMRIAAKRLRYVLELHAPVFGPASRAAAKIVRDVQELLGEIHDCDEMLPMVERHARDLRREDAELVRAAAPDDATDLEPATVAAAIHSERYRGLESLATFLRARRLLLYERFIHEWDALEERDFAGKLEWDLERASERAVAGAVAQAEREAAEREAARLAAAQQRAAEEEAARLAEELDRRATEESERLAEGLAGEGANIDPASGNGEGTSS